jgi:3-deoxy-D-manno-octulosonic-acid transferase
MIRLVYSYLLLPLGLLLALLLAPFHRKLRDSLRVRRGVWERLAAASARRDSARPLVWFHVASAGEFLQARPVLERCLAAGMQVALTVTSVSGLRWSDAVAELPDVVWSDVMPPDFPSALNRLWRALQPSALVYVQADLWPGLVSEAARRGTPQVLIAARGDETSFRFASRYGRVFYRPLYRSLRAILAANERDLVTIASLVPDHPGLVIAGDPGIETVLQRVREAPPLDLPPEFSSQHGPVLVGGSLWPADERHLLPVLREALANLPELRAILAPHEPDESHLAALEAALAEWHPVRLSRESTASNATCRVLLVDSIGKLASLYAAGTVAYVGGAFTTGVHNVAEPAAAGLPVLFGPRHANSAVAQALLEAGVAFAIEDAGELGLMLLPLLSEPEHTRALGEQARAVVERMGGAAERCFNVLQQTIPEPANAHSTKRT